MGGKCGAAASVHLYLQSCGDAALGYETGWLREAERSRAATMRTAPARNQFILGRRLARLGLSRLLQGSPTQVELVIDDLGQPRLAGPTPPSAHLSIAHSHGLVLCAVSLERRVGADVEPTARADEVSAVVDRFLTPTERRRLKRCPPAQQPRWLLQRWVDKEAWSKLLGQGLRLALDRTRVEHEGPGHARFVHEPARQGTERDTCAQLWHPHARSDFIVSVVCEQSSRGAATLTLLDLGDMA